MPVTLDLLGEPDAMLSAASLDFGQVQLTQTATLPLSLANAGCASLTVSDLVSDNPEFTFDVAAPFVLARGRDGGPERDLHRRRRPPRRPAP